jgi:hypothetical protein
LQRSAPVTNLCQTLYYLRTPEGDVCAGRVRQGLCLLLFTSHAAASAFADFRGVEAWPPLVFSRSRTEFQTQAAFCFGRGFLGGLLDAGLGRDQTVLVPFDLGTHEQGAATD